MTIQDLRERDLIVLECISGSRSYGLAVPGSDTDLRGVFVLPREEYYGLSYVEQVSSERNDEVFYELGRYVELLLRNNPNIVELLGMPDDCVLYRHPLMNRIDAGFFLSKLCRDSFANYALSQIKKAQGLNKKINRPMEGERRSVADFCYVADGAGSIPVSEWLRRNGWRNEHCGLAAVPHMRDIYALFIDPAGRYRGIVSGPAANEVNLSSIPPGETAAAYLHFNRDGYSTHCKEYKSYQEWVLKRNDARYAGTVAHGKSYDAKNMMHVFRLLDMAREIGEGKGVRTRRPNREELLRIRSGHYEYEDLLARAEREMAAIDRLFATAPLPDEPDEAGAERLLVELRTAFYKQSPDGGWSFY